MADTTATPDPVATRASQFRFVSRVDPEDAAAVTAVLLGAVDDELSAAASAAEPGRDQWVRSAGALRTPIDVGHGRWQRAAR
ncbi:hypothetical protein [Agromyces ramosus]|uniref:Acyl-CoA carboxylase epsilon subunit-like protein n=1 Tax=Agromyces ramosus TaxID=33879 RepID=A0ABU0RBD2_9MICO|nr:hypothetical protein [Agromyces ramosus]MDQ0895383.1 hypothetical protein [Agromyces ramosus]